MLTKEEIIKESQKIAIEKGQEAVAEAMFLKVQGTAQHGRTTKTPPALPNWKQC